MDAWDAAVPLMSIEELAARAGVRVRTVRFYVAEGLLPGPGARGRAAAYGEEHLLRLRLIRRLAERRVPLAEMRAHLAGLTLEEVRRLLQQEDRAVDALAAGADSASTYLGTLLRRATVAPAAIWEAPAAPPVALWQRWSIAPGVELHVREDAAAPYAALIRRLRRVAATATGETGGPAAADNSMAGGASPPPDGLDEGQGK